MELLEKVLDGENIGNAINKVVGNKGAGGIDKVTVKEFQEEFSKGNIDFEEIKEQIRKRKYII